MVNKRVQNAVLGSNLKNDRMISVRFQGKPFNITGIQIYAPINNAEEAEQFSEDLQDLLELTPPKDVLFSIGDWNAKVGSQETSGAIGKFGLGWSRAKTNRVLPRKCTGHSKHPLPTTQEKTLYTDITRWSTPTPDWLCSLQPKMEKLYTVSKTRPGADCGPNHELLIAIFSLKLTEKAMTPHSSTLAWKVPWMEEHGRLQSKGSLRDGHDWATSLLLFTFMHWRRKWQPTPVFLPGESQGRGSLVGCRLWGRTESDRTEVT